ncbi:MAG: DNA-processing protein DprA [Chloroflexota bacterium]
METPRRISPSDPEYPLHLRSAGLSQDHADITAVGDLGLLKHPLLALFCSQRCPGRLVNATYDLAHRLRDAGQPIIGGFHSPMENECLRILLRGAQPIIICPARGIDDFRVPREWRDGLACGRLLVISPFDPGEQRVTAALAQKRNQWVAAVANEVFIAYAAPGSATERFARALAAQGTPLHTLDGPENTLLLSIGARPVQPNDFPARVPEGRLPLFDQ